MWAHISVIISSSFV